MQQGDPDSFLWHLVLMNASSFLATFIRELLHRLPYHKRPGGIPRGAFLFAHDLPGKKDRGDGSKTKDRGDKDRGDGSVVYFLIVLHENLIDFFIHTCEPEAHDSCVLRP